MKSNNSLSRRMKNNFLAQNDSIVTRTFDKYDQVIDNFYKNEIIPGFAWDAKKNQRISRIKLINLKQKIDRSLLRSLRKGIAERQQFAEELKDGIASLESLEIDVSHRFQYLLGGLVFLTLFGNVLMQIGAYWAGENYDEIVKTLIGMFFLYWSANFVYDGWNCRKFSTRIKSFLIISKRAL